MFNQMDAGHGHLMQASSSVSLCLHLLCATKFTCFKALKRRGHDVSAW